MGCFWEWFLCKFLIICGLSWFAPRMSPKEALRYFFILIFSKDRTQYFDVGNLPPVFIWNVLPGNVILAG